MSKVAELHSMTLEEFLAFNPMCPKEMLQAEKWARMQDWPKCSCGKRATVNTTNSVDFNLWQCLACAKQSAANDEYNIKNSLMLAGLYP